MSIKKELIIVYLQGWEISKQTIGRYRALHKVGRHKKKRKRGGRWERMERRDLDRESFQCILKGFISFL